MVLGSVLVLICNMTKVLDDYNYIMFLSNFGLVK